MTRLKKAIIGIATLVAVAALAVGISYLATSGTGSDKISMKDSVSVADAENIVYSSDYSSLEEAVNDNLSSSSSSQKTLVLDKNHSVNSTITIPAGKYITIDLNKNSMRCYTEGAFLVKGTLTFIDSSESFSRYRTSTRDIAGATILGNLIEGVIDIQTDEDTYQEYLYISGGMFSNSRTEYAPGITVSAGGTFNMYAGIIANMQMANGGGICLDGTSSSKATFNMYGGAILGSIATGYGGGVYANYANCNLYGGIIAGNTASKYGGAVYVAGSSTVNIGHSSSVNLGSSLFDTMYIGLNSGGRGTIYTTDSSSVSLYDNLCVYRNTCTSSSMGMMVYHNSSKPLYVYGGSYLYNTGYYGGFYINTGLSMVMSGGLVYGNECTYSARGGAGIFLEDDATLSLTGGTFSCNKSTYGPAVLSHLSGSVSISGATFTYNESTGNGGCLYFATNSDVTIKNSTISYNYTPKSGGGIFMEKVPILTISNVVMEGNEAGGTGGAIYNLGDMTLTNSTIKNNIAGTNAGGIYTLNTSLALSDVEITGNTAENYGGGIYYYSGSLSISGEVIVTGNTSESEGDSNLYLRSGLNVTLGGSLSGTSSIGLKFANSSQTQITAEETTTARYKTAAPYFFLDSPDTYGESFIGFKDGAYLEILPVTDAVAHSVVKDSEGKDVIVYYSSLENALSGAASTDPDSYGTVVLDGDTDVDSTITVEKGTYVALDLGGATVTWTGSSKSNFFLVYGSLDLYDSEAVGESLDGEQTAGVTAVTTETGTQYRTVYGVMNENGVTTYYYYQSGAITGGQANGTNESARGGGVHVGEKGTFTMYGGTIYGNTSTFGGGVHNYGTFTMYGGAISENCSTETSASYNGAAFLNEGDANAYLYGGVIYGNVTSGKGCGVIDNLGTLVIDKFDKDDEDEEKAGYAKYDKNGLGPVISGNTSSGYGAILNRGSLEMNAGYVTLNSAGMEGGGVNTNGSGFTMTGGYITGNKTSYYGAGVHVVDTFTMTGGFISCNESTKYGGGVNVSSKGTFEMKGGEISNNTAGTYGGGINTEGTFVFSGGKISDNDANGGSGGGVCLNGGTMTMTCGTISGNYTYNAHGGGIYVATGATLTMEGGYIVGNYADHDSSQGDGGGVHVYGSFYMSGGVIACNQSYSGGGVYLRTNSYMELSDGYIVHNTAYGASGGGGMALYTSATLKMSGGYILYNTSCATSGGMYIGNKSTLEMTGGIIYGNTAATKGGGMWFGTGNSVTIGGDAKIYGNTVVSEDDEAGTPSNVHLDSGVKFTVGDDFEGTVYVYTAVSPSTQISGNTLSEDYFISNVSGKILSDQEYCVGYGSGGYVYTYLEHDDVLAIACEDGTVYGYYMCTQCFAVLDDAYSGSVTYEIGDDGVVYASVSDGTGTAVMSLEDLGGFVVKDGNEVLTWYQNLSDALENAGTGSTIILYEDVTGDVTVSAGGGITLDLNGHEIDGSVTAGASGGSATTLTICDSLGGGSVTGTVSGGTDGDESAVKIQSGTYNVDVSALADSDNGYYAVYLGLAEDGVTPVYGVYPESEITDYASFYVETEGGVRTYYTSFADAVAAAWETGTVVLACDAAIGAEDIPYVLSDRNLTIDLNGFSLEAYITIEAGSAESGEFVPGATLEITDSSEGTGSLSGVITLKGNSTDTEDKTGEGQSNSFENTLTVVSSAVTDGLTVNTSELTPSGGDNHLEYTFALVTDNDGNAYYGVVAGHEHVYDIAEAFMDSDGVIKVRIRCSCGAYYTSCTETEDNATSDASKADVFYVSGGYTVRENEDGTISYVLTGDSGSSDITLTGENGGSISTEDGSNLTVTYSPDELTLTMTPSVKIEWTENGKKVTYYLDEDTIDALGSIINKANPDSSTGGVTVTLLGDTYVESLEISGENVTIDLNGYELSGGGITLTSSEEESGSGTATSASLEITDSSASSETGAESMGEGKVNGVKFTLDSGSSLVLSGGTYVSVTTNGTSSDIDIEDCVSKSTATDGSSYCMVDNGDGTFTVTTKAIAEKDAAVKVVIVDGENTQEIYFGSIEAALDYIDNNNVSGAEIVLIKDCECEKTLDISSSVTIDLAGNTLTANITVKDEGSLTIKDSSADDTGDGTGLLDGHVSGYGDISVESGSFTEDVGQYVSSESGDEKVLLATNDGNGNVIYTVTDESSVKASVESGSEKIQAKITYNVENDDGTETEVTVYYESIEDAIASLKDGDTLTILTDVDDPVEITISSGMNVTVDLGGNTLTADITVEDGGILTIKDSPAEDDGAGLLDGSLSGDGEILIESGSFTEDVAQYVTGDGSVLLATNGGNGNIIYTVTDESSVEASVESGEIQAKITYTVENVDGTKTEVTVYYESIEDAVASLKDGDTITLLTDIEAEDGKSLTLTFENTDEDENVVDVTLDLDGHSVAGGISVGDGVNLTIRDSGDENDESGHVSGDVGCTEGGNLTIDGGIYDDDITEYVSDGRYIYAATTEDGYSFEVTGTDPAENDEMSVAAAVTYTDEDGETVTLYFEDLQDALDYASDISSGDGARGDVVVTLTDDYDSENSGAKDTITVNGGNFTIDLGEYTLDADVEISGDASVEITGDTESEVTGDVTADGASLEISGDTVYSGTVSESDGGEIEISGGTFSSDVSKWTEDGCDAIYSSEDGTYSVKDSDTVKDEAVASVTVTTTVGDEKTETTTYYDSFEDAMNALYEAMEGAGENEEFTLTLWDDVDTADMSEGSELLDENGALVFDGTFTFDLNENTFTGDITVADDAEIDMDLSGGKYDGDVTVGEDEGATFTVTDSSAEYDEDGVMTEAGTGLFDGTITGSENTNNEISVEGGTFTGDVGEFVDDEKYETMVGEGGESYVIVPKDDVAELSEAYVTVTTTIDGVEVTTTTYYESVEDAIKAAVANGGTVTLTGDASVEDALEISSSVTIDLNGHNLEINVVICADEGGSLTVTDSGTDGSGELSGTIKVVGEENCKADAEGNPINPYENILVMEGGAAPGADLTIDLSSLGAEGEFTYAETGEDNDGNTTYGIAPVSDHIDVYSIAVWTLSEDGTATLYFMCACGNYLCDKNGNPVGYTVEASVTDEGDGVYTFTAEIEIEKENTDGAPEGTYEKSWTVAVAATVEADGKTYYMSDLQSAIELAESLGGGVVTLYEDCDGGVEVRGDVEINLNGHYIDGVIAVDTGAYLIVSGDGNVGGLDAEEKASVKLRGGTYAEDENIDSYIDRYEGYVVFVNEDGSVTVMQESEAATKARASVTDEDGNTVYYESLEEAVDAMDGGYTLTLWDGIDENETVEIKDLERVTIDANGYDIDGTLSVTDCDGVTLDMGGGDITGTVTFTGSDNATVNMGGEGVSYGDIEGEVSFSGCDNSSVNMDGGDVKSTGSVEFTDSDGASFNAEGGDVAGSVTFDGCDDASVDMDGGTVTSTGSVEFTESTGATFDAEGGDINGSVSFTGCDGASVSMGSEDSEGGNINGSVTFEDSDNASLDTDGGNVAEGGSVSFDGCDGAKFDLDGGEMNGTVTFTDSDKSEFDLGGGTVGESGEVNFNQSEDAVIDLGDGTFSGTMNAAENSSVEITGSGDATDGTFVTDDESSLELHGGTYDKDTFDEYFDKEENSGYRVVENDDGSCTVMTEGEFIENASVKVEYQDDKGNVYVEHFATVKDALDFITLIDNAPGIVVTLEDDYSGSIEFDNSGEVTFDLSGHEVTGGITMTGGGTLTIVDSEGGAYVGGKLQTVDDDDSVEKSDIVVEGGTYLSESVYTYVDDEYIVVVGHDGEGDTTYTVMTEDKAIESSYVFVETYDEETDTTTKQYYETLEDAVKYADGGTIVLTGDLDVADETIEITTDTVIDTNGHSLTGDFVVVVADGEDEDTAGSLTVQDTSEDGTGSFTGKVTVEDRSTGASGEEADYSDAFVLEDGLTPDGVETDLSGLDGDGTYHFEEVTDEDGNTSYGIVSGGSHSFANPVWSVSDDGTITLELVCECGEYLTDENGDNVVFVLTDALVEETEDGRLHVTGTVEVKYTYVNDNGSVVEVTGSYDCDMYVEDVAAKVVTDDGTIYFFFDDEQSGVQSAVDFAETHGGYVTLYEDASNIHINVKTQTATATTEYYEPLYDENGEVLRDEDGNIIYSNTPTVETTKETIYTDVVIDLNGHNLEISIQADKGNSVTLTDTAEERGNADVGLSVDGVVIFDDVNITMCENVVEDDTDVNGEIWIRGDTTIDLNGMTIFNVNEIEGNLTLTGGDGSVLKLGDDIDLTDGSITIDGSAGIDLGGNDLATDILVTEGSSFDLNLNGATFSGDIELEDDASLTIRDSSVSKTGDMEGTVTAEGGADVEIYDGVYDPRDEDSALILDLGDDTVIQSATDASGETYYETVSSAEHETQGHGYDILTECTFNAESSTMTLYFECLCGYTSVRNIVISEDDYTTEVAEDGTVTVYYSVSGTVVAPNGSSYEYSITDTLELTDVISRDESANGYVYSVREVPDCYGTGLDTYTYGDGKGIVVKVVTPVTHRGLTDVVGEDGNTYHLCEICGSYVTDANSDAGYAELGDLIEDVGLQNAYDEEKQAALDELESKKDEIISGIDPDTPGYDDVVKKVEEIFDELYEDISGMDYEAQTETDADRKSYAAALEDALNEALTDAMVEVEKTANQEVSRNVLQDTYNQLYESGKYSDETLDELKGEFDAAIADLEEITVTSEDDLAAIYDYYLKRVLDALYAIKIDVALTTDDSAYVGSVTSTEGLDSGVEVVITDMGTAGYTFTTDAELIYKGSQDYTEDEVADLVEGKGIVAVFDISLVDSNGTEVYVFSGYYVVRINDLPESVLAYEGLQIVFVGDDGRIEIYETIVNVEEGYLEFTTTHFSEYMILGIGAPLSAGEKETDLMAAIIALAVVAGVLLILGIVLLIVLLMKKGIVGGKSKKTAALGIFALLAVVPAGGVAIVVVLAVLAAAFLAADIYMIYAIFTSAPVVEYVEESGDGENATADNAGDVTLSDSEDENRE